MADFRQYTNCVDIKDFDPTNPFVQAALLGLYVTLPPGVFLALITAAGGNPLCLLLLAEIYLIAGIAGYCYWWLFRRLICIPDPPDHPARWRPGPPPSPPGETGRKTAPQQSADLLVAT